MWLVGKSAQMLRGEIPFSTRMPYRIPVTEVSVSPTSATLFVNDTQQLTATVTPSNAINKTVTWSSNNPTTASVSTSGLITAKAAGTALITVTTYDGYKTASVDITVIDTTTSIVDYTLLEKGFNIYPNPSKGSFNVVIPGSYKHADYQVINFIGNIISVGKFNSNSPIINLKGISKGYYILKINTGIQMYFHKIQIE
jgi:transglutaminase/protease-like cytokinesis protein 3